MSSNAQNPEGYQPIDDSFQEIFDEDAGEIVCHINTLSVSKWKNFFYHLISILFLGIPYVVFKMFPKYKRLKYNKCCPEDADYVLVHDNHGNFSIEKLLTLEINLEELQSSHIKYFIHQHTKYIWSQEKRLFIPLDQLLWKEKTCEEYTKDNKGLLETKYVELFKLFDRNKIAIEIKSYWQLFIEEIFNPFYIFQAFAIILWCIDDYRLYAGCIVVLTLLSSITSLIQMRKQSINLRNIVESSKCHEVIVLRTVLAFNIEVTLKIDPEELVPGDLIILPASDYIMPCDAVLLTGQCIVNESVLTGESIPVTKVALHSDPEIYSLKTHKRNTLFSGTNILQTRFYGGNHVLARVVRTGFNTTKGSLVKSILFPTPINLQFYKESIKFVYVLTVIAMTGMIYCIYLYIERQADIKTILLRTLDIITIVVPPALPAAMAIGVVYSQTRLKKLKIYCISPPRIIVCGKIKLACFDKTGTLTDDGLILYSVLPCSDNKFASDPLIDVSQLDSQSRFVQGMATCHSLTRIDGKLNGDPLDLNMFEFTKWRLEEPDVNETAQFDLLMPTIVSCPLHTEADEPLSQFGIMKEFSFSSTQQCMSVIVKDLFSSNTFAFTKGAPEKLFNLCIASTLPKDFYMKLSFYTAKGFRVIALAYKDLPENFKWIDAQKIKRHLIECELKFLGFLILQNPLKYETTPVIKKLQEANVRTVMITGDNLMTGISVARDCGMVQPHEDIYILNVTESNSINEMPQIVLENTGTGIQTSSSEIIIDITNYHLAIDGKTWIKLKNHFEDMLPNLLIKTTIFARFQPEQKTQLITSFQDLDYIVSMVGDGANDCGALKAAHVGVSLSPAEASVAAPFTSGIPNISCLVQLILEGRCSLVTSFAIFKYMALYSLIQFFSVLILYKCYSTLGDYQFLFIDMILITSLAVTIGRQGPSGILCRKGPLSSLISPKCLLPLFLQIFTNALFQIAALWFLYRQHWFEPIPPNDEEIILSWENTVIFTISSYQYITAAWHMSKGRPYRQVIFTNYLFMLCVISLTILITWMAVYPCKPLAEFMEIIYEKTPEQRIFMYYILLFPIIHFIVAGLIEICIGRKCIQILKKLICYKSQSKKKYKRLLNDRHFSEYLNSLQISNQSQ